MRSETQMQFVNVATPNEMMVATTDSDVVRDFGQLQENGGFSSRRALIAEVARRHGRSAREVYALLLEHQAAE